MNLTKEIIPYIKGIYRRERLPNNNQPIWRIVLLEQTCNNYWCRRSVYEHQINQKPETAFEETPLSVKWSSAISGLHKGWKRLNLWTQVAFFQEGSFLKVHQRQDQRSLGCLIPLLKSISIRQIKINQRNLQAPRRSKQCHWRNKCGLSPLLLFLKWTSERSF